MNRDELFFDPIEDRQELAVVDLEDDDGVTKEYAVLSILSSPPYDYEYMCLMALEDFDKDEEEQELVFMRYTEEDDSFVLEGIDNEVELDCVVNQYYANATE